MQGVGLGMGGMEDASGWTVGSSKSKAIAPLRDLAKLPKCELHVHLEGAMRTTTLVELCSKHGIDAPQDPRGKFYSNFDAFAACYVAACECLRNKEDVSRCACEWLQSLPSPVRTHRKVVAAVLLLLLGAHCNFVHTRLIHNVCYAE